MQIKIKIVPRFVSLFLVFRRKNNQKQTKEIKSAVQQVESAVKCIAYFCRLNKLSTELCEYQRTIWVNKHINGRMCGETCK